MPASRPRAQKSPKSKSKGTAAPQSPSQSKRALKVIECDADVQAGIEALRRKCPIVQRMHDLAGYPPLRRRAAGFEGLARIIVGQQVSVASATAIWERTFKTVQPFDAAILLSTSEVDLRRAGLSRPKVRTLTAIARAIAEAGLDLGALEHLNDEEVHEALTRISGVGPWTADIFLMFCIGRADCFAAGDLALQVAAQMAMNLDERPSAQELLEIAERWRPWRGVAARMLWAYYKVAKEARSGAPV